MIRLKAFGIVVLICLFSLIFVHNVQAWGVAYGQKELTYKPNSTHLIRTSLQNMVGDESIVVYVSLNGDTEIITIDEKEIDLPPLTRSHPVYINVTIPETDYKDQYVFSVVYTEKERAGIMVNIAMEKVVTYTINVKHQNQPENGQTTVENQPGGGGGYDDTEYIDDIIETQKKDSVEIDQIEQKQQKPVIAVPEKNEEKEEEIEQAESNIAGLLMLVAIIGGVSVLALWKFGWI